MYMQFDALFLICIYIYYAYVYNSASMAAKLIKEQCRLDMRKYSFSQRVINEWNKLK